MHEVGLISDALQLAFEAAARVGSRRIERLNFILSPAGHVTEDGVRSLVSALGRGTPADGADVTIEWREARWQCWSCATRFRSANDATCPRCGESALSADDEPALYLGSIDVPENQDGDRSFDRRTEGGGGDVPGATSPAHPD
jgi:hydrogenase nickel incorporation protein HypA/HybF